MKVLARCSYDGSDYCGFARSQNKLTIQSCIENTLKSVFTDIPPFNNRIIGGSRTDKGVHALDQCFTFYAPDSLKENYLLKLLNHHLPGSIRIHSIKKVPEKFQLSETILSKAYIYLVSNTKEANPFIHKYLWLDPKKAPIDQWNQIFTLLKGKRDFSCFAKESKRYASTVCNLYDIQALSLCDREITILYFWADRFLYNMIRRIIGFTRLVMDKQVKIPSSFDELISTYRTWCSQRAPAQGLYLYRTFFSEEIMDIKHDIFEQLSGKNTGIPLVSC